MGIVAMAGQRKTRCVLNVKEHKVSIRLEDELYSWNHDMEMISTGDDSEDEVLDVDEGTRTSRDTNSPMIRKISRLAPYECSEEEDEDEEISIISDQSPGDIQMSRERSLYDLNSSGSETFLPPRNYKSPATLLKKNSSSSRRNLVAVM